MQSYLRVSPVEPRGNEGGKKQQCRIAVLRGRLASLFLEWDFLRDKCARESLFADGVLSSKQLESYNSYSSPPKYIFAAILTDNREEALGCRLQNAGKNDGGCRSGLGQARQSDSPNAPAPFALAWLGYRLGDATDQECDLRITLEKVVCAS